MSTVIGEGYLGNEPELKVIGEGENQFSVTDLRICETDYKLVNGEYVENGTIWWNVSCKGKVAEEAVQHLQKGAYVHFTGRTVDDSFTRDGDQHRTERLKVWARSVTLGLRKIEQVSYKPKVALEQKIA